MRVESICDRSASMDSASVFTPNASENNSFCSLSLETFVREAVCCQIRHFSFFLLGQNLFGSSRGTDSKVVLQCVGKRN